MYLVLRILEKLKIIFVTNKYEFGEIRPFLNLALTREVLPLNMSTICTICEHSFATSFNLKRHMETVHAVDDDKEHEGESISESKSESDNETSKESQNEESSENSDESDDDDDKFSYGEVAAILRYTFKSN